MKDPYIMAFFDYKDPGWPPHRVFVELAKELQIHNLERKIDSMIALMVAQTANVIKVGLVV